MTRRALAFLGVLLLGPAALAAQVPPDADWRTFDTEHFRVHFVADLEPVARRAADRAEDAYALLARELLEPPSGRIHLVVADNVDFPNGFASPLPRNRIVLYAHPPVGEPSLAYYDDWLELLVLHELVHIFHLDTSEGVWERLRVLFGRNPLLFPSFLVPGWVTEGLATFYESHLTRAGRVRGTLHDMVLRTAILEDEFFTIDRATGDPVRWPAGSTRYIYGSLFIAHLARTAGQDRLSDFLRGYAGRWIPYRVDASARRAFGASFSRAWEEWADSLRVTYGALADSLRAEGLTGPELLTEHGRVAFYPRYAPAGGALAYAAASGLDEPALRLIESDGRIREIEEITSAGPPAWLPGGEALLAGQLDFVDPYRIYSDLHRFELRGGDARLTRGARLWEPDVNPDGRRVVVVTNAEGSNRLAIHDLRTGETRPLGPAEPDVHWALPRWSPSGDRIAASRWTRGGFYDVVVLDTTGAVVREITRDRAIDAAPAWSPDGRYLLFSSDRTGIPNLYAYDLREGELRQVTNVLTGAFQPDVSPDGRWIAFSYYRADGYHVARIPYAPDRWRPAPPLRPEAAAPAPVAALEEVAGGPDRDYSPWPEVLPTAWSLVLEGGTELGLGLGAQLFGEDPVERHAWSAQALAYFDDFRFDGGAAYRYRGLGLPVLEISASQDWSVRAAEGEIVVEGDTIASALLARDRELEASALWLLRRWRAVSWIETGGGVSEIEFSWQRPEAAEGLTLLDFPMDLGAWVDVGYSSARGYGISIGPQDGVTVAGTLEGRRYLEAFEDEPDPRGYLRFTGRGRAFRGLPLGGFARHVAALRLQVGAEGGSRSPGFSVGGASGAGSPLPFELGLPGGLSFPVRGYEPGVQRGNRAVSASAEYRFPLVLVERGFRLVPLFLSRIWGDLFADAGAAWCAGDPDQCFLSVGQTPGEIDPIYSVGGELLLDLKLGYFLDLPLRFGAALPLRGETGPELYLRIGRSF